MLKKYGFFLFFSSTSVEVNCKLFLFWFVCFEMESHSITQAGVQWCDLGLLPPGFKRFSCLIVGTTGVHYHTQLISVFFVETGFHHVAQAGCELLGTSYPSTSAFQSAEITGISHWAWPNVFLILLRRNFNTRNGSSAIDLFSASKKE
uniref:Uncharacterized protein n=1 Tax=Macaca fascicularis TaxID=9541 RepID=A0A7N9CMS8_MACFA